MSASSNPRQFVRIPHSLLTRPGIRAATIATYAALASYANREGLAWPSIPSIAKRAGLSEKVARRECLVLVQLGYLDSTPHYDASGGQRSNRYTLLWQQGLTEETHPLPSKLAGAGSESTSGGGVENDSRTIRTSNENHPTTADTVSAARLVAENWTAHNKSQGVKSVIKVVQESLTNGVAPAELAAALRELDRSKSFVSELSITLARSTPGRRSGTLKADQKVDWDQEKLRMESDGF